MKTRLTLIVRSLLDFLKINFTEFGYTIGTAPGNLRIYEEFSVDQVPDNFAIPALALSYVAESPTMIQDIGVQRMNHVGFAVNFYGRNNLERDNVLSQMKAWFERKKRIPLKDFYEDGEPIIGYLKTVSVDSAPLRMEEAPDLQKWRGVCNLLIEDYVSI